MLRLNGIDISAHYTESEEARTRGLLRRYLEWGGFPEIWVKEEFAGRFVPVIDNILKLFPQNGELILIGNLTAENLLDMLVMGRC